VESRPRPFYARSQLLAALEHRVAVARVAGAAHGDTHDWVVVRRAWAARAAEPVSDAHWWVGYLQGDGFDERLAGCVVQIVALDPAVACGAGPWPFVAPEDGRLLAAVRLRVQRLDDDGFVEAEWTGGAPATLRLRLGSRATLRAHARRDDGEAWAVRLYRLLEVVRDWTPAEFQS
jgi:hypothetical protein